MRCPEKKNTRNQHETELTNVHRKRLCGCLKRQNMNYARRMAKREKILLMLIKESRNKNCSGSRDHSCEPERKKGKHVVKSEQRERMNAQISSRLMNGVALKLMFYPIIFPSHFSSTTGTNICLYLSSMKEKYEANGERRHQEEIAL